jgi:hypothetical protein
MYGRRLSIYELECFLRASISLHAASPGPYNVRRCYEDPILSSLLPGSFFAGAMSAGLPAPLRCICVFQSVTKISILRPRPLIQVIPTSTVSNTLITPGCRSVLNLRSAFFARGRCDLFAFMSKLNMLHLEPSSCKQSQQMLRSAVCRFILASCRYAVSI